jgi:integrase
VFPARPNPRFTKVSEFKKPHRWDMGRRFKRACKEVGIPDLRIHDLRHMVATVLMEQGIPEGVIRKLTGHRSRELERYQHLSEALKKQTVDVMAGKLFGTPTGTPRCTDKKPTQVGFVKSR